MESLALVAERIGTNERVFLHLDIDRQKGTESCMLEGSAEYFAIWKSWIEIRHLCSGFPPGWTVLELLRE